MINSAFSARLRIVALVLILSVVVAGCANVRRGVSWPALDTVSINGTTAVVVAYDQEIDLVNPRLPIRAVPILDDKGDEIPGDNNDVLRWVISGADYDKAQFFTPPLPLTEDGKTTLLFPTYNSRMLEFDLQSAKPTTTIGIALDDGVIAAPLMTEDLLYVPYRNGDLVALDRKNYEEQWRLETQEGVWASPLLQDGILYVPSIDHLLYAVNAETGETLWTVNLEGAIVSTPRYADGFLYVGSYSHKMYKIDLNGQIQAMYEGQNWIWATPVLYDGILYFADLSGSAYALNPSDLSAIWTSKVVTKGRIRGIRPAPLVTDKFVIVASRNGTVYWLDRNSGETLFEQEIEGKPEVLSDLLLLEAGSVEGVDETLIAVGTTDKKKLVVFFELDTSRPYGVYDH